jgi:hypothetical protein
VTNASAVVVGALGMLTFAAIWADWRVDDATKTVSIPVAALAFAFFCLALIVTRED